MSVVPRWIDPKVRMTMVSLQPRYPALHMSAFIISWSGQVLIVKDWSKIVKDRNKEVLGGSNQMRNPQLGDKFIYVLQYDEARVLHMFYTILPEREQYEWLAS